MDNRLTVTFLGYDVHGNFMFVDQELGKYKTIEKDSLIGDSVLSLETEYVLRSMPGSRYIVEGLA